MEDSDGDKAVNNIPQRSLNLIYGSISSYFSVMNFPKLLDMIKQTNNLVYVLVNIKSGRLGAKDERNKRVVEV